MNLWLYVSGDKNNAMNYKYQFQYEGSEICYNMLLALQCLS